MRRKIICLITACLLIIQSVCLVGVAAAEDNSELTMFKNLGVIDTDAAGTDTVTRDALAKAIAKIVYNGTLPTDKSNPTAYTDISAEQLGYINAITKMGIMNGVGNGCFAPEANVTYVDALKTVVAFMGYSVKAEDKGGYPSGYLSVASELGITKNISADTSSYITFDSLAWILKNASDTDMVYKVTDSKGRITLEKVGSFLSRYMNIEFDEGAIKANYIGSTESDEQELYNVVAINGGKYRLTTDTMSLRNHLGEWAKIYYKTDGRLNYIVHYEIDSKKIVSIDADAVGKLTKNKLFYYDEKGREKSIKFSAEETSILYNNSSLVNYDDNFLYSTYETKDGRVTCIDNDGDGTYDVISIDAYETHIANKIIDDEIFSKNKAEKLLKIEDIDNNTAFVNAIGEPIKFSDIAVGDTLCVAKDIYGRINTVTVLTDKLSITLSTVSYDSDGLPDSITIADVKYKVSNGLKHIMRTYPEEYSVKIGKKATVYFNKELQISEIIPSEFESYNTAYLVDHAAKGNMDTTHMLKVFSANGTMEYYTLEDNISFGYERKSISADDFVSLLYDGNSRCVRQIIIFTVSERTGKINWADICCGRTDEDGVDGLYRYAVFDNAVRDNTYISYTEANYTFCGLLLMSTGTTIFVVPSEAERDKDAGYKLEIEDNLENNPIISTTTSGPGEVKQKWEAYGTEKNNPCAEVLVHELDFDEEIASTTVACIVTDAKTYLDDNGNEVSQIFVLKEGKPIVYSIDTLAANTGSLEGRTIEKGDVLRCTANAANEILMVEILYDCSEDEVSRSPLVNEGTRAYRDGLRMIKGKVVRSGSTFYEVEYTDATTGEVCREVRPYVYEHAINGVTFGRNRTVTGVSKVDDYGLYAEEDYPTMPSTVFLQCNNGYLIFTAVYN